MDGLNIKLKYIRHEGADFATLPVYKTAGSAGCDLVAAIAAPLTMRPGERTAVPTGVAVSVGDPGYAGFIFARSGLGLKHGIGLPNGVGVIDSDYTGELLVALVNLSSEPYTINPGDRIAQLVFMPVAQAMFEVVAELPGTTRGGGGFGSTGTR